ncbi:hypothetical protein [Cecembia rubra]|uniref:Castor and Pollux protein voltage-gated ion channel component n=1 Tax=Cecembia rubra TaxID=1485585 RepID=A0A2P8E4W4_9BACT|nr:hypothetical protein [Cecembia rubra]PSL04502.1 hypothetical protein CLV48_105248 [Cecembia rubra]
MSFIDRTRFFSRKARRFISPERFALAPIWIQLIAIFITSATVIFLLSPFLGGLPSSYRIFADPAYYADVQGPMEIAFGLLQVIIGLILFSFIISVLSAALIKLIENIKSGSLPYKKSGHILFVNYNIKLFMILDQIDIRARDKGILEDVVLLFHEPSKVVAFRAHFDQSRWKNLDIFIRQGNVMSFRTFDRLSIFEAKALVVLSPDNFGDTFESDNFNLKILTNLTNNILFLNHLKGKQENGNPIKCSIELSSHQDARKIALNLTSYKSGYLFAVITPGDVIGSIIARAKVDPVYYKVFFEILSSDGSTIHFIDPRQFGDFRKFEQLSFEQLMFSFKGGTLIGFSSSVGLGHFQMNLCSFGSTFKLGSWFIFLTTDAKQIRYQPPKTPYILEKKFEIIPPNEEVSKKICVIGNTWNLGNIEDFIDVKSKNELRESQFVFEEEEAYFSENLLLKIQNGDFDNIVINLGDELGFRLTMLLVGANKSDPQFLSKIITILGDPITEQLLNTNVLGCNIVLSHKLSARYIAQLAFQKNLEQIFAELAFIEGSEFNLLDVGKHIPAELLRDVEEVKRLLAAHEMIYLGTVDQEKNVILESRNFDNTKQVLVLSKGKII